MRPPNVYKERPTTFGSNLTNNRIAAGLTQQELAQLLGTSHVQVSRWERGHTQPQARFVNKIEEIFPPRTPPIINVPVFRKDTGEEVILPTDTLPPPRDSNYPELRLAVATEIIKDLRRFLHHHDIVIRLDSTTAVAFARLTHNLASWDDDDA